MIKKVSQFESQNRSDVPINEEENLEIESEEIQQEVIEPNENIEGYKKRLSFFEVERITNNFTKVIGNGGSGVVYSCHLSNGIKVAVKRLLPSSHQAFFLL